MCKPVEIQRVLVSFLLMLFLSAASFADEAAAPKVGKYPLIAGTWQECDGIFVHVRQHKDRFVATCTYRNDDNAEIHWRAEGKVTEDGDITASLVHTRPDGYKSQTRTAKLDPDGKTITGHAAWDDGGHDFTWTLMEPAGASGSLARHAFVPPHGKCLLLVGQDNKSIDEYVAATGSVPGGVMVYTGVHDFGNAADFNYLLKKYPRCAFQVGLYMVDSLDKVVSGEYDDNIQRLGEWIKSSRRPVYLRVGYEFDFPGNHYEPGKYINAYRHVHDKLDDQGLMNIAYVWHSFAAGALRIEDWYPGDEYVDWVAVSFFAQPVKQSVSVAECATRHSKPLMVAESTPRGLGTGRGQESWDKWFARCFGFINQYHVKAFCYINWDWESLPMFRGQGWGDCRIQINEAVKNHWLKTTNSERFLRSSRTLYKELGY